MRSLMPAPPLSVVAVATMPSSDAVRRWLDRELEGRGIDAVVYTRHVLDILQQQQHADWPPVSNDAGAATVSVQEDGATVTKGKIDKDIGGGSSNSSSSSSRPGEVAATTTDKEIDGEERNKSAAVECLLSVSEQKCGIEELVEELCLRLKGMQCKASLTSLYAATRSDDANVAPKSDYVNSSVVARTSPEDQAEKYNAAFPALNCSTVSEKNYSNSPKVQSINNQSSVWDNRRLSSSQFDEAVTTETIKATRSDRNPATIKHKPCPEYKYPGRHQVKPPRPHHHQHHHSQLHLKCAVAAKLGRDHSATSKPSFIVPKCKFRILKQRIPHHKGKTPFSIPETTKSAVKVTKLSPADFIADSERVEAAFSNELGYDSSFEDGESEEGFRHLSSQEKYLCPQSELLMPTKTAVHDQDDEEINCISDAAKSACNEEEVFQMLKGKFNEDLASIWSSDDGESHAGIVNAVQDIVGSGRKISHNHYSKGSFVNTMEERGTNTGWDLRCEKEMDAMEKTKKSQKFSEENNTADPSNAEDNSDNCFWKCAPKSQDLFVDRSGLYGLKSYLNFQDNNSTKGCGDMFNIGITPADSDFHTFGLNSADSPFFKDVGSCDISGKVDNLNTLWEVLGAIGTAREINANRRDNMEPISNPITKQNNCEFESNQGGQKDLALNSIWVQLDRLDVWAAEESPMDPLCWEYSSGNFSCKELPYLELTTDDINCLSEEEFEEVGNVGYLTLPPDNNAPEQSIASTNACNLSVALEWGIHTLDGFVGPSHSGLHNVWSDGQQPYEQHHLENCNHMNGDNDEHSTTMTRSYDSYLNKETSNYIEECAGVSGVDIGCNSRSEPALCNKPCTITHHGESLFVEVLPQRLQPLASGIIHTFCDKFADSANASAIGKNLGSTADVRLENEEHTCLQMNVNNDQNSLTTGEANSGNKEEEENLLISDKTHFRPIRQRSQDSDGTSSSDDVATTTEHSDHTNITTCEDQQQAQKVQIIGSAEEDHHLVKHEDDEGCEDDGPVFTQAENGLLRLRSGVNVGGDRLCQLYMLYRGHDPVAARTRHPKELTTTSATAPSLFVPKFKLLSNMEKFCQTDEEDASFMVKKKVSDGHITCDKNRIHRYASTGCGSVENESKYFEDKYKSAGQSFGYNTNFTKTVEIDSTEDNLLEFYQPSTVIFQGINLSINRWNVTGASKLENAGSCTELSASPINSESERSCRNSKENCDDFPDDLWALSTTAEADSNCWPEVAIAKYSETEDLYCRQHVAVDPDERDFWTIPDGTSIATEESDPEEKLKSLKEEIRLEEEELFDDINQMRELDLRSDDDNDVEDDDCGLFYAGESGSKECRRRELSSSSPEWLPGSSSVPSSDSCPGTSSPDEDVHEDEDCPELEMINGERVNTVDAFYEWLQGDDPYKAPLYTFAEYCNYEVRADSRLLAAATRVVPFTPQGKVVFSSELEEQWIGHSSKGSGIQQVLKKHSIKAKLRGQRRPCTFFMEGNCRRTDCKFSHDLGSITCRFWEEGSCFKGLTCPFMHGYSKKKNASPSRTNKKTKDFRLEESEFPSLSKSADSTSSGSWMASALSIKQTHPKKKRNRPRHHSASIVETGDGTKCNKQRPTLAAFLSEKLALHTGFQSLASQQESLSTTK